MISPEHDTYVFTCKEFTFTEGETPQVYQWEGEDALSRGYRFRIDLAMPIHSNSSWAALLGKRATFANAAREVYWHGIVTRLQEISADNQYRYFQVTLEPRFSLSRLDRTSRVHASAQRDITLKDLVEFTFQQCQDASDAGSVELQGRSRWEVKAEHEKHFITDFVCQYEESSYDFLSRHLEHAGIYYAFENHKAHEEQEDHEGQEQMVFYSDVDHDAQRINLAWHADADRTLLSSGDAVHWLSFDMNLAPQHVALREYDPNQVRLDLFAPHALTQRTHESPDALYGTYAIYGEHYTSKEKGDFLAQLRAEHLECTRNVYTASGCAPRLRAGCIALVAKRGTPPLRVVQVWHAGKQPLKGKADHDATRVDTRWTAIPHDTPFRPDRITPVPRVPGLVTAVVESANDGYQPLAMPTANAGTSAEAAEKARDYPYINKDGYYRIRFHFAENDLHWQQPRDSMTPLPKESAAPHVPRHSGWVRMATPYAGSSGEKDGEFGMYFPLNEGTEVLVSFLNGNPDRPVIIGAAPNSDVPSLVDGDADLTSRIEQGTDWGADKDSDQNADMDNKAPQYANRIAGVVTQGGNMLAFNNAPKKQRIALRSPVADSYIVIGGDADDQDAQGILLHSKRHIAIQADSKVEEIPGKALRRIYDLVPAPPGSDSSNSNEATSNKGFYATAFTKKPNASASTDLSFSASASASFSLDFAFKLGASFTATGGFDANVNFAAKSEFSFIKDNRVKKIEVTKTVNREATVLFDTLSAGRRSEALVVKETDAKWQRQYSSEIYRNEAGKKIVLAVGARPDLYTEPHWYAKKVNALDELPTPSLRDSFGTMSPVPHAFGPSFFPTPTSEHIADPEDTDPDDTDPELKWGDPSPGMATNLVLAPAEAQLCSQKIVLSGYHEPAPPSPTENTKATLVINNTDNEKEISLINGLSSLTLKNTSLSSTPPKKVTMALHAGPNGASVTLGDDLTLKTAGDFRMEGGSMTTGDATTRQLTLQGQVIKLG